nr:hypothetical protein [uncultured Rhodopila sp.]
MTEVWTIKDWFQIGANVFQALGIFGIIATIWIYRHQSEAGRKSEMQANRSRLTEAYMSVHAAILSQPANINIAAKLIRRGYDVFGDQRLDEMTVAIELMYLRA